MIKLTPEHAETVEGLLAPDVAEALKKGLHIVAYAAVYLDNIVGALAGSIAEGEFEIESLYVDPDFRRKGVGRAMLDKLSELLEDTGYPVAAEYTEADKDSRGSDSFFRALDFSEDENAYPRYLFAPLKDFHVRLKSAGSLYDDIQSFAEVPEKVLKNPEGYGGRDLPIPPRAFRDAEIDKEASFFALMDERLIACVISEIPGKDAILVHACGSDGPDMGEVLLLLSYAEERLRKRYSPDTGVYMLVMDPESEKIIHRVLKDPETRSYRFVKEL